MVFVLNESFCMQVEMQKLMHGQPKQYSCNNVLVDKQTKTKQRYMCYVYWEHFKNVRYQMISVKDDVRSKIWFGQMVVQTWNGVLNRQFILCRSNDVKGEQTDIFVIYAEILDYMGSYEKRHKKYTELLSIKLQYSLQFNINMCYV